MKTVLLIEDDDHLRELLAQYLKQTGWQVFEAGDGESGISLAKQHRPAAVVCDMLMPRGNGYQVCAALRKDFYNSYDPLKASDDMKAAYDKWFAALKPEEREMLAQETHLYEINFKNIALVCDE